MAGLTTFVTVVYIVAVNSTILSDAGIPVEAGVVATVLASCAGSLLVGLWANAPIVMVPGMGINVLFTYTFVQKMGLSWSEALAVVLVSGVLFTAVAFSPLSGVLQKSVPGSLKEAITVGIGLLLTLIGLQKGGLVVSDPRTLLALGDLGEPRVLVTCATLVIGLILYARKVPGSLLLTLAAGTVLGIFTGLTGTGGEQTHSFEAYHQLFGGFSFAGLLTLPFWVAVFSLTMVIIFENFGLIQGQLEMLRRREESPQVLKSASLSTLSCGWLGTSPTVATVETVAGITAGGRTGLTAVTTGLLFLLTLFAAPWIGMIPDSAVAPILILIGGLMLESIRRIPLQDFTEGFPAYLVIALIPLTHSIPDGIAFGFVVYPLLKLAAGRGKDVPIPLYIISGLFLLHLILRVIS
ncbi:permease [Kroppenstedtia guangzhouensis]|uniref:Permease n=2 Tax=Kroppenstedtia guangzhouensis TaxID=1274356 RepID=A0ABQ1H2B5_9BACL|nr:permease [Kroppenstedtia guangzhouensis]